MATKVPLPSRTLRGVEVMKATRRTTSYISEMRQFSPHSCYSIPSIRAAMMRIRSSSTDASSPVDLSRGGIAAGTTVTPRNTCISDQHNASASAA